jgi:hypothetical protein
LREIAKDVLFYSVCNYYTRYISFADLCVNIDLVGLCASA